MRRAFALLLRVPNLSFFWCARKAVLCNCGIHEISQPTFLKKIQNDVQLSNKKYVNRMKILAEAEFLANAF